MKKLSTIREVMTEYHSNDSNKLQNRAVEQKRLIFITEF